ncbi:MAG TPA: FlgD immunoglobulin-like domain containing protein [Gemmatimonadaceae bacterium]
MNPGIPSGLLCCALLALGVDAPRAGGLPSIPSSTYPYYQTLAHYTFDDGANPDPQGWTTHDLTAQYGTFWHVDDMAGLPEYGVPGSKVMWCGVRPGVVADPFIHFAAGYGNHWTQIIESQTIVTPNFVPVDVTANVKYDLRPGDRLEVQYITAVMGLWTTLASYTGTGENVYPWTVSLIDVGLWIRVRFVVTSDYFDSDELIDTAGAVVIDDFTVSDAFGQLAYDDFESASVGSTTSSLFHTVAPTAFGNYAGLQDGDAILQSGTPNGSHVWSFMNGSPATQACAGLPGEDAVPYTASPGSTRPGNYLTNEVRSPWIDLSVDQNSQPVDPGMGSFGIEFDVYADLHATNNMVRYTWRYRFMIGGTPTAWAVSNVLRSSNTAEWKHEDVFTLNAPAIAPGATHVQIALIAIDYAYSTGATSTCHTAAPLFDNVTVHRMYKPLFVLGTNATGPASLAQAILIANQSPDFNAILFHILGPGPHVIPAPTLNITSPVWIDGFTQDGSLPNTSQGITSTADIRVALNGTSAGPGANGLSFAPGGYGVVRGLAIGGYSGAGIRSESTSLVVTGCYLGLDASGTSPLSNGVGIDAVAPGIDIGGPLNEERMLVSASVTGIRVHAGSGPILNTHLGFDAIGFEMANNNYDIHVLGGTSCPIGRPHITPCGSPYTDRVRVGVAGIGVEPAASGVMISQARLSYPFVDLGIDGPTANDPLDADTGANGMQNHPVLTSADGTTIFGDMDGLPNQLHRIEFFAAALVDGETQYLGYQDVTTDGAGHAAISLACNPIPPATAITATARAGFNTSELAPFITSTNTPPGDPLVNLYDPQSILRASVEFGNVTSAGNTFLTPVSPAAPAGWNVGGTPLYWDISTNANYTGPVEVFLHYDPNQVPAPENMLRLLHLDNGTWVDITTTVDTDNDRIGGITNSLSPFVLAVPNGATGVDDARTPGDFALHANVPNPFNPVTTIDYDVPAGGADVTIAVFDVSGRLVRTLVDDRRDAGRYSVRWNGDDDRGVGVATGVYFCRMNAGSFAHTMKMVLLK